MYQFANDLFVEESDVSFYGFRIQTRMAAIRLPGSRLVLYSPVALTPRLQRELDQLGEVTHIVSPNKIHNLTLTDYRSAFPDATLLVPPGLPERVPALSFDSVLTQAQVDTWSPDIRHALTRGNVFFAEALLFHGESGTLLVGDLVEIIGSSVASSMARTVARTFGVRSHPMASPEFRLYTTDAEAFEASIAEVLKWPIRRIFMCHGELIEDRGREVFVDVTTSLLESVRNRSTLSRALAARVAKLQ